MNDFLQPLPETRRLGCPFCLFVNEVSTGAAEALCLNCGLSLGRLLGGDGPAPAPARQSPVDEAPAPVRTKRGSKRRRRKKDVEPWLVAPAPIEQPLHTTVAGTALAGPQELQVAPTVVSPPVSHVAPPPLETELEPEPDESLEATIVYVAASATQSPWTLELATGEHIVLPGGDVVVGRHPEATNGATPVKLPDPARTLSRTHARLRHDRRRDIWTIEDLGSSNGVATYDSDTKTLSYATPGQPVDATEYILIGKLEARLYRPDVSGQGQVATGAA